MAGSHNIKHLKQNELLFKQGDVADNLYIVKSGIVRIYQPKGKGFIELAVVHQGEIVGEMALFNEGHKRRSASAEAIVGTELYEVSFDSFLSSYEQMNPWFQAMLSTLVNRLDSQNKKVKSFESNSVTIDYKDLRSGGTYNFFKELEIVRLFTVYYMAFKCESIGDDDSAFIHESALDLYAEDIFSFNEAKLQEFTKILCDMGLVQRQEDEEGKMKNLYTEQLEIFKKAIVFFNRERHQSEDKRLNISDNCIKLFEGIKKKNEKVPFPTDHPTVNIQSIINDLKKEKVIVNNGDYHGAIKAMLMEEPYVNSKNEAICNVDLGRLISLLPLIKIKSALECFNQDKRIK